MRKIALLFIVIVMNVFIGCKKEDTHNYPDSLAGTVWESDQFAGSSGTGTIRLEFFSANEVRLIIRLQDGGEIGFHSSGYTYQSGEGVIHIREPWTMKIPSGEVFNSLDIVQLKEFALSQGNYTVYQQLVEMERQVSSIAGIDTFSVEGSVVKWGKGVLSRK